MKSKIEKQIQMQKMIDRAMKSPQYQNARKKDMEQAALRGYMCFCMMACDYLELKHGYKKNGLMNFLEFASKRCKYVEENDQYFIEMNQMFIDECGIDVLGVLGMKIEKEGEEDGEV